MKDNYPENWPEIAERIKRKNNYRCEICKHEHDPGNGYCLTVHHLDRDPQNNEEYNLASACQRCHLRLEGHAKKLERSGNTIFSQSFFIFLEEEGRRFPQIELAEWFKPHWEGYLEVKKNESL